MILEKYITFVKSHETLIIVCLAACLLFRTGQGIENMWIRHDDNLAKQAATKVVDDTTNNKSLTDQLAELKSEQSAHNQQIDQQIKTAILGLSKQQQIDSQATQQQIIDRWKLLIPMKPGAVVSSGGSDTITPEAANQTVQALERIPVLELQVADLNEKLLTDDGIIGKQGELITGLNKQITDEKLSHTADVNLEKAKARKSFLKGFKIGVVVGAVGLEAIRIGIGRP